MGDKRDDSEEYHDLCAVLEGYCGQMTTIERDRTGCLSQDLYTVSDPPKTPEPITPDAQSTFGEVYEAQERGEWDLALVKLQKLDKVVPAPLVAYLRGRIWEGLENKQVAAVFFGHASRLNPENQGFQAALLNVLKWTDMKRAMELADAILAESNKFDPYLVVRAVEVFYDYATGATERDAVAVSIYRRIIGVLNPLLERTVRDANPEPATVNMIVLLLATCYRWIGEIPESYHFYSLAISLEPWNAAVLVARGIIVYGTNSSAISDFEQAIKLGSQIVWPYYFMAHFFLTQGRFEECQRMCEQALGKPAPERIQSELFEFSGISIASLGYPIHVVQRIFENAIRIDPSNQRAKQNLQRLLAAIHAKATQNIQWERPSDSSVRSFGLQQTQVVSHRGRRNYSMA